MGERKNQPQRSIVKKTYGNRTKQEDRIRRCGEGHETFAFHAVQQPLFPQLCG
ncbi:hypothetical protein D3C86_2242330 [compost metagenome]